MKVKLFEEKSMSVLEDRVNSFISIHDIEVISQSIATTQVGYSTYYTISIMYNTK